jgi:glycogen phosphorylase
MDDQRTITYFSMEIALENGIPTYSGGLGILAGDTIRSAADLRVPMVGVTLLHRKGYFYQKIDASGVQREEPVEWVVEDFMVEMPERVAVVLEGRKVQIRAWRYDVQGIKGFKVPVFFLDTDLPENGDQDRTLTHFLYGGDKHYRLCQEVILGIGGVRVLRALGYGDIQRFHLNEGHAALLTLELLDEEAEKGGRTSISHEDIEAVRKKCVFTTHTPVAAGHDQFPLELVNRILGRPQVFHEMQEVFCCEGLLNLTYVGLNLSHYVNGVAKKHGETSRLMFAGYAIDAITNGVHAATWVSEPFGELYDRHISGWREDSFSLRYALSIPREEIWKAHLKAKRELVRYVNREANAGMDTDFFTVGFARRAAPYKRADLLFTDLDQLRNIASRTGRFQIVYAGKAHPQDQKGKEIIRRIFQIKESLKNGIKIAYLENYDMELGKLITSGVDLWLNTPRPPLEASGTSGMKAALNGVPSLSVLDGWWVEGYIDGITGWSIGDKLWSPGDPSDSAEDARSLYTKLEQVILPLFYQKQERFIDVMRGAIALNGSFFNTHRMLQQYVLNAYFR